ncbi:MAG: S8 family peptidase, partial [Flavobacteriales bacterium]|nr:S8 family peptidase [Flavobacteriales bacterium]
YLGSSAMIAGGLPTQSQFPDIVKYVLPDNEQKIVDSWACSEHVLTVANYQNETNYIDYNGLPQSVTGVENDIAGASSNGPTRDGRVKPDLAAPGDITFSAGPAPFIASLLAGTGAFKVAPGGYHLRAGGTSIASPVAAGSLALYFEKCPNSTHLDAIRSFELSTFGDVFTGALPNIRWGAGKLNAFDALVRSAEVPITFDPSPVMCFNDSVLVSGPNTMAAYAWNTGASTQTFYATEQSVIALEVVDDHGCHAWSDTLAVLEEAPLPTPTIAQVGYTLESSAAVGYQWFYNGTPINGATDQALDVYDTGDYFVQVSNVSGCTANSDTLFVLSTGLGDAVHAGGLEIWPVPATDVVSIRLPLDLAGKAMLEVVDAQGKLVQRRSLQGASPVVQLSLQGLATGLYQVRIGDGTRSWTGSVQVR